MSHEIIKQPNGLYAIWSTIVDDFVAKNLTEKDIVRHELYDERKRVEEEINSIIFVLDKGKRYKHFRMWEEIEESFN